MTERAWSLLLAFGTSVVLVAVTWGELQNKTTTLTEHHLAQERKIEDLESRLRALETSRRLEEQIGSLTSEVAALKATVDGMRTEIRKKR
jgi:hypothetical protein